MRPIAAVAGGVGYWVAGVDGTVAAFGDVVSHGSLDRAPNKPIVGMAPTASGKGYWLVASDGGLFAFGDAGFYGSLGGIPLNKPVVGMASTASGKGYWLVASDGGLFAFGDAGFFGSMGGTPLNKPVVAMGASPSGKGYIQVASDGGVFAFGDAAFHGSTGHLSLAKPIVGGAMAASGKGYWFVGGDGGVFAFGQPGFLGSAVGKVGRGAAAMAASPSYVVNTVPVATADSVTTAEDRAVTIDVLANDRGLVDGGLTVGIDSQGTRGAAAVSGTTITYTPNADLSGTDTFRYRVTDIDGDWSVGTVTVSVTAVNDPPALASFSSAGANPAIDEDTSHAVDLSVRDPDHSADTLSFSFTSSNPALVPATPAGMTLTGSGSSRTLTLRPAANQSGTATITVKVTDGAGASDETTVNLTVRPVNDPPVISAISAKTTNEDTPLGPVSFTVTDVDDLAGNLVLTKASGNTGLVPTSGINLGSSGGSRTVAVTPALNQNGVARITITATDPAGASDSEGFDLTVNVVNDAPTISDVADSSTDEDVPKTGIAFTVGDVETAPGSLVVTASSSNTTLVPAANVTLAGSGADRTVSVTPAANQSGTATVTLTVTDGTGPSALTATDTFVLTVTAVNDAPTISLIADQTIDEDTATAVLDFTIADVDSPLANLTVSAASNNQPVLASGGITLGGSGANRTVKATPVADAHGTATVTVSVSDGTATGTESFAVNVTSVDDVVDAVNDTTSTAEDTAKTVAVLANDIGLGDGGIVVEITSGPGAAAGTAAVNPDKTITYTPASNFDGTATIGYRVADADGDTDTATLTVDVTPVNDPPTITAIADDTVAEDTVAGPYDFTIADVDDSTLTGLSLTGASSNQAIVADDDIDFSGLFGARQVRVTPRPDAFGNVTITVTVSDGDASDQATFDLAFIPVDDQPVAANDSASMDEDAAPISIDVLANDDGIGDVPLTVTITAPPNPAAGTATVNPDKTVRFSPIADFYGTATFTYRVTDGDAPTGDFDEATVTVTVNPTNDGPSITIVPTSATTAEDTATAVNFTVADPDHDPLLLTLSATSSDASKVALATSGIGANRTITVTPAANAVTSTPVTITVTVADPDNATATDSFTLTITPVADPPTADNRSITTAEDTAKTATLTGGDVDPGDTISFEIVADPTNGTLSLFNATTGAFTYTPNLNYFGTDSFTFRTKDSATPQQSSGVATVSITVTAVNDLPTITDILDQTINEDTATGVLSFTITDVETAAGLLQVSGSSSPELVDPITGYVFSGTGGSRQVTITPKPDANGTATITITVTDTDGGQASDTFTLTVTSVNDAPVANADTGNAVVNGPTVTIAVRANDTDPDHATSQLTVSNPTGATRGTVTCTASECQYTPTAGLLLPGTDTFTYTITDPGGLTHTATVTVVVGLV